MSIFYNIIVAFEEIINSTKIEKFVYIYYFKYNIQEIFNNRFYNKFTKDLALIIFIEKKKIFKIYFYDRRLTHYFNIIITKKLTITLVLDCYFSKSVYCYKYTSVWYLFYNTKIDSIILLKFKESFDNIQVYKSTSCNAFILLN